MSAPDYMRLLPRETLATIGRLELLAREPMDGFVAGRHRSPRKGFSVEFSEHRQYTPGDDLRNFDWRVLARTNRRFIKQFVEETNLRATLLLDVSGSMAYAGGSAAPLDGRPMSKFEYARRLAAALAYLLVNQQDAVGMALFDCEIRSFFPARARASQMRFLLEELYRAQPGGETSIAPQLHQIAERIPHRGLVIVISDLLDDPDALLNALHHFRHHRHELLLFHVMAEEEIRFPFEDYTAFEDLEAPGELVNVDPRALRANYLDAVKTFLHTIEIGCGQIRAEYVPLNTRIPYDRALADYLARRRGSAR
ncbi:MAG: DUF58 domain-containing protein [Kiritimatiellia bacterium]|jgi:uncharacterized protein (DUF58 family)